MFMFIITLQIMINIDIEYLYYSNNIDIEKVNFTLSVLVYNARAYILKNTQFSISQKKHIYIYISRLYDCFQSETTFIRSDYFPYFSVNFLSLRYQFY